MQDQGRSGDFYGMVLFVENMDYLKLCKFDNISTILCTLEYKQRDELCETWCRVILGRSE